MTWKGLLLRMLAIPPAAAFNVWLGTIILRWLGVTPSPPQEMPAEVTEAPPHVCPKSKWTKVDLEDRSTWPPGDWQRGHHGPEGEYLLRVDLGAPEVLVAGLDYPSRARCDVWLANGDWWTPLPPGPEEP